jgi:hypothetical protein
MQKIFFLRPSSKSMKLPGNVALVTQTILPGHLKKPQG